MLFEHFVLLAARRYERTAPLLTSVQLAELMAYSWPGNVRELRNAIERGVILAPGPVLGLSDLPTQVGSPPTPGVEVGSRVTLDQIEAEHIRRLLASSATIEEASETLGIDPSTLYRKRKRYGL